MSVNDRVIDLLVDLEERRARGEDPPAEEVCAACPELLPELRRRLDQLRVFDSVCGTAAVASPDPGVGREPYEQWVGPELRARYRPVRFHAAGGLGEVHSFEDTEFGRTVALKRMRGRETHNAAHRGRFLREAKITARLEHPGVVPVYGRGTDARGNPCYAMRFVKGETLEEGIERLHAPADGKGDSGLLFRQLLGRFVAVCNTVAYAHSRGVVHRDLKPANVLLGEFGETLVIDWGLAKSADGALAPEPGDGAPPSLNEAPDVTQPGAVMGTPAYMAPEQAAGRMDEVGPASDVYSLGATLYALLTGRPPPRADEGGKLLDRVARGDFPPPRATKPDVPRALEEVCLKAMAHDPAVRYADARDLAADVERWLLGEPVSAYGEPWPDRAARWARRHRTGVTSVAASLVVALVCVAVAAGLLYRAYRDTASQRDLAREALKRTEGAIDKNFTLLSQRRELLEAEGLGEVRKELLESAAEQYRELIDYFGADPAMEYQLARAYANLAANKSETGGGDDGERSRLVAQAERISEKLMAQDPHSYQAQTLRAYVLGIKGDYEGEATLLERSLEEYPDDVFLQVHSALSCFNAANVLSKANRLEEAIPWAEKARSWYKRLVGERPGMQPAYANSLGLLADINARRGHRDEALRQAKEGLDLLEKAYDARPDDASLAKQLAEAYFRYDLLIEVQGDPEAGRRSCGLHEKLWQRFLRHHPTARSLQRDLMLSQNNLGMGEMGHGNEGAARKAFERAREMGKQLAPPLTDNVAHIALYTSSARLGFLTSPRDVNTRLMLFEESLTSLQQLYNAAGNNSGYRDQLVSVLYSLGTLRLFSKEPAKAREYYERGRDYCKEANPQIIDADERRQNTVQRLMCEAGLHLSSEPPRPDEAAKAALQADKECGTVPGLVSFLADVASTLAQAGKPDDAIRCLKRGLENGLDAWEEIEADPGMDSLRGLPAWQEVTKLVEQKRPAPSKKKE